MKEHFAALDLAQVLSYSGHAATEMIKRRAVADRREPANKIPVEGGDRRQEGDRARGKGEANGTGRERNGSEGREGENIDVRERRSRQVMAPFVLPLRRLQMQGQVG